MTISGTWSDSCVPSAAAVTVSGKTIRIDATVTPCSGACLTVLTNYTLTTTFQAPAAGSYSVEYYTIDCAGQRSLAATRQIGVFSDCYFGESLRAERPFIRAGETTSISWCDPSTLLPDGTFIVDFYRIFHSRSAAGPFVPAGDLKGGAVTSFEVHTTIFEGGVLYFYVEAHGVLITLPGEARDTVRLTEIIAITLSSATGCAPSPTTLCLGGNRFQVTSRWRTAEGRNGDGRPVPLTADSGSFWFFDANNVELTVKVLNACGMADARFWVFAAGMTNVEVELVVTDTNSGTVRSYSNPLGTSFKPVLDTSAFPTCP